MFSSFCSGINSTRKEKARSRERERERERGRRTQQCGLRRSFLFTSQCAIATGNDDVDQALKRFLSHFRPFVAKAEFHGVIQTVDNGLEIEMVNRRHSSRNRPECVRISLRRFCVDCRSPGAFGISPRACRPH